MRAGVPRSKLHQIRVPSEPEWQRTGQGSLAVLSSERSWFLPSLHCVKTAVLESVGVDSGHFWCQFIMFNNGKRYAVGEPWVRLSALMVDNVLGGVRIFV